MFAWLTGMSLNHLVCSNNGILLLTCIQFEYFFEQLACIAYTGYNFV